MTCYDPAGNALGSEYTPCKFTTSDGFAPCCQLNIGPCLQNLACEWGNDTLIRGGCTDFTFRSRNCPQFLLEGTRRFGNLIHNCGNGTGCYNEAAGASDQDCSCQPGAPNLLLIFSNTIVYAATSSSSIPVPAPSSTSKSIIASIPTTTSISAATRTAVGTSNTAGSGTTSGRSTTPGSSTTTGTSSTLDSSITSATSSASDTLDSSTPVSASSAAGTSTAADTSNTTQGSSPSQVTQAAKANLGLEAGLPVGLIVGIGLLAAVIFIFWKRRSRRGISSGPGIFLGDDNSPPRYR